ncbi:substrate-binding periplasmic protein [Roseateles violae]|uniref:Transporter substrate-binding domain-containing protein n=1 Tax=Roseateles violae TaxID=3058042 RepID=A0ABT8DLI1_9BURK|nr:transporter substrate-binding domain-containing protein [Pelomonas sp. PFR6]MDN3918831.1 transporter substrate-binding domain-containing protein [Pelomonas sp. PFR6]
MLPPAAQAGCTRTIRAPMAPSARLVLVENGQLGGVWPELLRQVGEASGCRFELPVMPRARLEMEFLSGQQPDLMISATRTEERDRHGLFVPLYRQPMVLLTRSADAGKVDSLEALRKSGWRMAVPRSFAFSADYRALVAELEAERRVDTVNDIDAVARMLRAGRVDFALLSPPQAQPATGAGIVFRRFDGLPLMEVGFYLSRQNLAPADQALLREALTRAAREGQLRRAFLRYYPAEVADLNLP